MHRLVAAVALTVVAALGTGCGSSAGGDPPGGGHGFSVEADTTVATTPTLTKAKFIAHVNSLCRRKWPFVLHAFREYRGDLRWKAPRLNDKQRWVKSTRLAYFPSIGYHIYDWVIRLGAPPGEKRAIEEVVGSMREGMERGQRLRPVTDQAQVRALFDRYNRIARGYGLDECLVNGKHLPHGEP